MKRAVYGTQSGEARASAAGTYGVARPRLRRAEPGAQEGASAHARYRCQARRMLYKSSANEIGFGLFLYERSGRGPTIDPH